MTSVRAAEAGLRGAIDDGLLERAAAVLQGKSNVYETDLFLPIVQRVCQLTGQTYGAAQG
ncbi:MAG: hypothetical protein IH786_12390, partial [Proteobacteria bacterium]|nr:hypothetical protein [Pseudomonadota bacterium]